MGRHDGSLAERLPNAYETFDTIKIVVVLLLLLLDNLFEIKKIGLL